MTSRRAALSWSPATDNDSIGKYNLRLIGNEEIVERSTIDIKYTFENLKANTTYTVELTAEDRSGNISDKTTLTFTTLADNESEYPVWDPEKFMRLAIVLYTKASSMKLSTGLKTIIQVNLENGDLGDRFLDS